MSCAHVHALSMTDVHQLEGTFMHALCVFFLLLNKYSLNISALMLRVALTLGGSKVEQYHLFHKRGIPRFGHELILSE